MSREKIDPDTGLTPTQQKEKWARLFESPLVKKEAKQPKRRVGQRQPKSNNSLKPQAIELFRNGKSVKDVSSELGITYANANYYKKFV